MLANVTINWTFRENLHSSLRRLVERILRAQAFHPDSFLSQKLGLTELANPIYEQWTGCTESTLRHRWAEDTIAAHRWR